ncbi:DnaJ-class molecular chaperone with C-terminal Zn finger domain [Synechococcus sp. PCC 7502]|uniref:IMS domain-containing protein n=1 Tax=Synechococcus sp. PCC 7502 TaxID=1173263 RepID=UPI00029F97FA|nr:IMS domain-containing protein [Synechococcus sp. PCC 7502]AFY73232.1 DnaJ-class molecular chaperone with C-terminal Zn finger domain [Synechococcus sp. PCC 7502]
MRIQLDYYRILGLTPQAKIEQINQAYSDRNKSLPRREYSEKAISSRQKLLNVAHTVLADSSQRQLYDAQILPELLQSKHEHTFSIEIDNRDLCGAMLLLYELGEYDQIIKLSTTSTNFSDRDFLLTTGLAYLELGREFWSQGKYQAASYNYERGYEVLAKSEFFAEIKQELQAGLWQLRPYRVLELIASPETKAEGIALLKEILEQRRGIDGKGDDHSGLNIDKFLQFILEIRAYMTTAEQEQLFEEESRRPSLVASYLSVYALIAKGVSQSQPNAIRKAKNLLSKIGSSQNIYLEIAICALLLGQLTEATEFLDQSNETERLTTIYAMAKPENDPVKGLYQYTQVWLNTEIYPHFKDLIGQTVDLDSYFSDRHVQAYINELPNTSPVISEPLVFPQVAASPTFTEIFPKNTPKSQKNSQTNDPLLPTVVAPRVSSRPRPKARYKFHPERLILFLLTVFAIGGGSIILGYMGWNYFTKTKAPAISSEPVLKPVIIASLANLKPIAPIVPNLAESIDQKLATEIITTWQKTKADALGSQFKLEGLEQILAEPLLTQWRSRATGLKNTNSYAEYILKSATVKEFKSIDKNQASVLTNISEVRNYYTNGQLDQKDSKQDTYDVEYILTKTNNKWLISAMNVR